MKGERRWFSFYTELVGWFEGHVFLSNYIIQYVVLLPIRKIKKEGSLVAGLEFCWNDC